MRLVVDLDRVLRRAASRSGTPSRSAATTSAKRARPPLQELAFTLADGFGATSSRGLAPRAARRRPSPRASRSSSTPTTTSSRRSPSTARPGGSWAEAMRDRVRRHRRPPPGSCRFHAQTAGCSLQDQPARGQPGPRRLPGARARCWADCQSLHTNSMDETLALPSEHAVTLALATQQVLAC